MSTLLLPLVSTGNVSQLCVDLVLHSGSDEFTFVKELDSIWLHSFIGPLDFVEGSSKPLYHDCKGSKKQFTTPLELFYNKRLDLYVIQQRSPVISGYENQFFKEVIIPLIKSYGIESVIVLDSAGALDPSVPFSNANYQHQYATAKCQLESLDNITLQFQTRLSIQDDEHSIVNQVFHFDTASFQQNFSADQPVFKLFHHVLYQSDLNLKSITYLSKVVHEGDNSWDAFQICEKLSELIQNLIQGRLTAPVSWKGVYGARPIASGFDQGIYS
ncbi:Add66 [Kluyveromyces lactis]|nr:Add66 [Kluyveromyces lactis]